MGIPNLSQPIKPLNLNPVVTGMGSDFADQTDLDAYNRAIAEGKTMEEALDIGDNCIGCYGDVTGPQSSNPPAYVALPASVMIAKWGSVAAAKFRTLQVTNPANGKSVIAQVGDEGPGEKEVAEGHIIDMNSTTIAALGLVHPVMAKVAYQWL